MPYMVYIGLSIIVLIMTITVKFYISHYEIPKCGIAFSSYLWTLF